MTQRASVAQGDGRPSDFKVRGGRRGGLAAKKEHRTNAVAELVCLGTGPRLACYGDARPWGRARCGKQVVPESAPIDSTIRSAHETPQKQGRRRARALSPGDCLRRSVMMSGFS
jgi:hypothetical protein